MIIVKAGTNPEPTQYELNNRALARKVASEGYVLLETGAVKREDLKRSAVRMMQMIRSNTVLESK